MTAERPPIDGAAPGDAYPRNVAWVMRYRVLLLVVAHVAGAMSAFAAGVHPSPGRAITVAWTALFVPPLVELASIDAHRYGRRFPHGLFLLVYATWPVTLPWMAFRLRGRRGARRVAVLILSLLVANGLGAVAAELLFPSP